MDINIHIRKCNIHRITIYTDIMPWLMDYQISEIQILPESRGLVYQKERCPVWNSSSVSTASTEGTWRIWN
jgi:hypothetical protein